MDTIDFTLFEKVFHDVCTIGINKKSYEKRLLYIMLHRTNQTYTLLQKFNKVINHVYFNKWLSYTLFISNFKKFINNHKFSPRETKEQRLIIRKVVRLARVDIQVLRICDFLIFSDNM